MRCHRVGPLVLTIVLGLAVRPAWGQDFVIGANFTGSNFNQSGFFPPDTMGSIGPNNFVESLNGTFAIYDRTGANVSRISQDQFWANAGVMVNNFSFDPRITYDPGSGRWFASAADGAGSANSHYLLAVSNSSDPSTSSGWHGFSIVADPSTGGDHTAGNRWADFPMLGLNNQGVFLSSNMFQVSGGTDTRVSVLAVNKADLTAPTPTLSLTHFQELDANATGIGFSPQPSFDPGATGTALNYKLLSSNSNTLQISTITGTIDAPTSPTGVSISVPFRSDPPPAHQMGGNNNIDTGDIRFSARVVVKNGELWAARGISNNSRAAVEWFRINVATNAVIEQGIIADPARDLYYPSIAVNGLGDAVISYSASSPTEFIGTYVSVGKTSGSGSGTTTFTAPSLLKAGVANYQRLDDNQINRWGDYSSTTVDPNDPTHFWTIQEWASATNEWSTQVTEIIIVPEPIQILLIGAGMLMVGWWSRRFRPHRAEQMA